MIKKETLHPQNEPNIDIYPKTSVDQIEGLEELLDTTIREISDELYVKQVKEYPDTQNTAYAYCIIFEGYDSDANPIIRQGLFPLSYNNIKDTVVVRNTNGRVTGTLSAPITTNEFITQFYADNKYLSKTNASDTYLSKTDANNEYLKKTVASEDYLLKTDANDKYLEKITTITTDKNAQGRIHSANKNGGQDIITVTMLDDDNDGATGNWSIARRDPKGGVRSRLSISNLHPTHCVTKQIADQLYASKDRALVIPISRPTVESVVTIDTNGSQGITPITNLISGSLYRHTVNRGLSNFTVGNYNVLLPDDSYVYSYSVITAETQYNSSTGYDKLLVQSSDVYLPAKATIINTNSEVSIILHMRLGVVNNSLVCIARVVGSETEVNFSTTITSKNIFSS